MRETYITYLNNTLSGAHYCCNQKGFASFAVTDAPYIFRKLILPWPFLKLTCRLVTFENVSHVKILVCISICS